MRLAMFSCLGPQAPGSQTRRSAFGFQRVFFGCLLLALGVWVTLGAWGATITVEVDKPGHGISPLLYGIFFEDTVDLPGARHWGMGVG